MNRTRIRAAAAAAVLLGLLLLPSAPALGASCPLGVSPSSGPPGSYDAYYTFPPTPTSSTELYDPETGSWTTPRAGTTPEKTALGWRVSSTRLGVRGT